VFFVTLDGRLAYKAVNPDRKNRPDLELVPATKGFLSYYANSILSYFR
jgi:hypothetical protein